MRKSFTTWIARLYNQAGMLATLSGGSIFAVFGTVSGYIAKQTAWIAQYGPIAWWAVGVLGAAICLGLLYGLAHFRYRWASASTITKWKEQNDNVNPLDTEFTRKRIKLVDLVNPFTKSVSNKRFIDCELLGPANFFVTGNSNLFGVSFISCDAITTRARAKVTNVIAFQNIEIIRGSIAGCTIFIAEKEIDVFVGMGANIVTRTGRGDADAYLDSLNDPQFIGPQSAPPPFPMQPQPLGKK